MIPVTARQAAEPPSRPAVQPPSRRTTLLLLLAAACGPGTPPGPEEEALPNPGDTLVTAWAEYPLAAAVGGRWVVVAADWDQALLTDFARDTLLPVGGPRQQAYLHPFQVFGFRDTVYLADWGRRRTTVWSPEGSLVDSIPFADPLRGAYLRARDGAGQLYFQVDPQPRRDGSGNLDSAAIVRTSRSLTRFDTVARLAPLELAQIERQDVTRFEQRIFSGNDLWGVWPDGMVWIARRFRNQIESFTPQGERTRGPPLPDPVYEVTPADREIYLRSYPPELRPKEEELAWAIIFPPFTTAFTTADGSIWLEKSKQAADTLRRIQVLDRAGNLRRLLVLRGQGRLVAVGLGKLLIAERFGGGMRLLEVAVPEPQQRER
ncbi:MAG: hypothetical protein ACT4PM_01670 [Gemmatimonadales bacterium]